MFTQNYLIELFATMNINHIKFTLEYLRALQEDYDLNFTNENNLSPLYFAIKTENLDFIKYLMIHHGLDLRKFRFDNYMRIRAGNGNESSHTKELLMRFNAAIFDIDEVQNYPHISISKRNCHYDIVIRRCFEDALELLDDSISHIEAKVIKKEEINPLIYVLRLGCYDIVNFLLDNGFPFDCYIDSENNPITVLKEMMNDYEDEYEIINELLNKFGSMGFREIEYDFYSEDDEIIPISYNEGSELDTTFIMDPILGIISPLMDDEDYEENN